VQAKVCLELLLTFKIVDYLGENNDMLRRTLQLGISLLHGGNREVQKVNSNRIISIPFSFIQF
jgi:hypothetical protein